MAVPISFKYFTFSDPLKSNSDPLKRNFNFVLEILS